jgi:hypothetical protein
MSTPVTINTTAIQYQSNTTECHCVIVADSIVGATTVQQMVVLDSADLADDWTDAQLCEAVATKLGVPVEDVSVAVQPEPVAPPEPPAPVIDGEGDEVGGAPVYNPVVGGV